MKVCHNCGFNLPDNAKFCVECGAKQGCPKCGTPIDSNIKFCPECGEKLTNSDKDASTPAVDKDFLSVSLNAASATALGADNLLMFSIRGSELIQCISNLNYITKLDPILSIDSIFFDKDTKVIVDDLNEKLEVYGKYIGILYNKYAEHVLRFLDIATKDNMSEVIAHEQDIYLLQQQFLATISADVNKIGNILYSQIRTYPTIKQYCQTISSISNEKIKNTIVEFGQEFIKGWVFGPLAVGTSLLKMVQKSPEEVVVEKFYNECAQLAERFPHTSDAVVAFTKSVEQAWTNDIHNKFSKAIYLLGCKLLAKGVDKNKVLIAMGDANHHIEQIFAATNYIYPCFINDIISFEFFTSTLIDSDDIHDIYFKFSNDISDRLNSNCSLANIVKDCVSFHSKQLDHVAKYEDLDGYGAEDVVNKIICTVDVINNSETNEACEKTLSIKSKKDIENICLASTHLFAHHNISADVYLHIINHLCKSLESRDVSLFNFYCQLCYACKKDFFVTQDTEIDDDTGTEDSPTEEDTTYVKNLIHTCKDNVFKNSAYISSEIPDEKIAKAILEITGGKIAKNKIILFYDDTWFGAADEGIVFTEDALYYRDPKRISHLCMKFSSINHATAAMHEGKDHYAVIVMNSGTTVQIRSKRSAIRYDEFATLINTIVNHIK